MCIRYDKDWNEIVTWSKLIKAWMPIADWTEGLDTFPGYEAPILVRRKQGEPVIQMGLWGLVPPWAKDAAYGRKSAYNARSETLLEKPTFREAFRKRRCIVPMTAFYETGEGRWTRFRPPSEDVLLVAGLYEPANSVSNVQTFTMVTTEPNELIAPIQDRMLVILTQEDAERWLDPQASMSELRSLMVPCPPQATIVEDAGPMGKKADLPLQDSLF